MYVYISQQSSKQQKQKRFSLITKIKLNKMPFPIFRLFCFSYACKTNRQDRSVRFYDSQPGGRHPKFLRAASTCFQQQQTAAHFG